MRNLQGGLSLSGVFKCLTNHTTNEAGMGAYASFMYFSSYILGTGERHTSPISHDMVPPSPLNVPPNWHHVLISALVLGSRSQHDLAHQWGHGTRNAAAMIPKYAQTTTLVRWRYVEPHGVGVASGVRRRKSIAVWMTRQIRVDHDLRTNSMSL